MKIFLRLGVRPNITTLALILLRSVPTQAAAVPQRGMDTAMALAPGAADRPVTGKAVPCTQGKILNFACRNVELLAYLPNSLLGGAAGGDMWGWTDSATGREFVLLAEGHTAVVEVTDPVNPKYLGVLLPGGSSIKVYQHYAFVTSENNYQQPGLRVFDLTQLRRVKQPPITFVPTVHNDSLLLGLHTMALNPATGFLYGNGGAAPCGRALTMIDVRTPTRPTFTGCYVEPQIGSPSGSGAVHDSECVRYHGPDRRYQGHEICLAAGENAGVAVADVTDKSHPKTLSIIRYPDIAYAHQGWFSKDQRYFYLDDEFDELADYERYKLQDSVHARDSVASRTRIFDLADLDEPVVLPDFVNHASHAVDHNLYIRDRYMYQGNNSAGLRIIDIANPAHPTEAGYLTDIGDAWGTYPFLKHGTVAVSTTKGLVLARLRTR